MHRIPVLACVLYLIILKPTDNFCQAPDSLTNKLAYIAINRNIPPLQIGQIVPDTNLFKTVNYKDSVVRISDFKGKLLILDFWHKWCTACIAAFPRLQALQEKFGSRILILPVTFQSRASVLAFQEKRKSINLEMKLPSIIEDTMLRKYFPHDGDPYEVWISPEGKIIGITEAEVISEAVLEETLSGNLDSLRKASLDISFDSDRPLLIDHNGGADSSFVYRSLIAPYNPNIRGGGTHMVPERWGKNWWFRNYNQAVLPMIKWTLTNKIPEELSYDPLNKRLLLKTKQPGVKVNWDWPDNSLTRDEQETFKKNHFYSFDLIIPSYRNENEMYRESLEILENFFSISVKIEKSSVQCLALVRTSSVDRIRTTGKKEPYVFPVDSQNKTLEMKNRPISSILFSLNCEFNVPLVVDKTLYKNNVDLELNFPVELKFVSLKDLRDELKKYDLDLVPTTANLDMLVIDDRIQDSVLQQLK